MPLILLLLKRSLYIVQQAESVTLNLGELAVIQYSLYTLTDAIEDRVKTLTGQYLRKRVSHRTPLMDSPCLAVHRLQNLDHKEQMKKFFYGVVRKFAPDV